MSRFVEISRMAEQPIKPNVIDRVVTALSPIRGAKRMRARRAAQWIAYGRGGYDGGRVDKKGLQGDLPYVDSAKTALHPGLWALRARTRDLHRNSAVASGTVEKIHSMVLGTGLRPQPQIDRDMLGLTDDQADEIEGKILSLFDAWAHPHGGADMAEEWSFATLQNQVVHEVLCGGDVLCSFRWRPRRPAPFASCIQLFPAERVSNPELSQETTRMSMGVETNATGRVTGYFVSDDHPGEVAVWGNWRRVPARIRTGERTARLVYDARRVGGVRGVPVLAPVILELRQITDYTEAELQATVASALFTVFVKSEAAIGSGAGPIPSIMPTRAEDPDAEDTDLHLGHGTVVDLAEGEDVTMANMTRPNHEFDPFVQAIEKQIGMAVGVPYEVLTQHFSASYSASRAAVLEAYRTVRRHRLWLTDYFCQPAYEHLLTEAVAMGHLDAPGFFEDPLMRRAWCAAMWTGDGVPSIDPVKEAKGAELRVAGGFSSATREARELTGTDHRSNMKARRREAAAEVEVSKMLAEAQQGDEDGKMNGGGASGPGKDGNNGNNGSD